MPESVVIVGISGASGAGKSQIAHELFQQLGNTRLKEQACVIHEDSYYRDQSDVVFEQRELTNYDHPDAFEHSLLVKQLNAFRNGEPIQVPEYDYSVHNRSESTTLVKPSRLLILEGILVLHDPAVRELLDIKVFVDVPLDICLARRIRRDTVDRERSVTSILDQFETTVRPMYFQFVEPTKEHADIIVPRGGENKAAIQMLLDHLLANTSQGL